MSIPLSKLNRFCCFRSISISEIYIRNGDCGRQVKRCIIESTSFCGLISDLKSNALVVNLKLFCSRMTACSMMPVVLTGKKRPRCIVSLFVKFTVEASIYLYKFKGLTRNIYLLFVYLDEVYLDMFLF